MSPMATRVKRHAISVFREPRSTVFSPNPVLRSELRVSDLLFAKHLAELTSIDQDGRRVTHCRTKQCVSDETSGANGTVLCAYKDRNRPWVSVHLGLDYSGFARVSIAEWIDGSLSPTDQREQKKQLTGIRRHRTNIPSGRDHQQESRWNRDFNYNPQRLAIVPSTWHTDCFRFRECERHELRSRYGGHNAE